MKRRAINILWSDNTHWREVIYALVFILYYKLYFYLLQCQYFILNSKKFNLSLQCVHIIDSFLLTGRNIMFKYLNSRYIWTWTPKSRGKIDALTLRGHIWQWKRTSTMHAHKQESQHMHTSINIGNEDAVKEKPKWRTQFELRCRPNTVT